MLLFLVCSAPSLSLEATFLRIAHLLVRDCHVPVHGNYYGTSKKSVANVCDEGKVCILVSTVNIANVVSLCLTSNTHLPLSLPS